MPRIRMLTTAAGPTTSLQAGQEYDVPGEVASPLVTAGAATWVGAAPVETAVVSPPEMRAALDEPEPATPAPRSRRRG